MDIIHPALRKAIAIWRTGNPIPLTLFSVLLDLGFDVEALEQQYRTS